MSDKRTQLIEATIDLFSKEGFWNTSTARISKHARVATGTLFNYFESKEKLIDEVYLELKREMGDHIRQDYPETGNTQEKMNHIWIRYATWAMEFPVRYKLLDQLRLSDLISAELQSRIESELAFMFELVQQAHEEGLFGTHDLEYVGMLIHACLEATINLAYVKQLSGEKLEEHIETGAEILWRGLKGD